MAEPTINPNSILQSVRKVMCGSEFANEFDTDLIMHINTVFNILTQLGAGPKNGFAITGDTEVWSAFTSNNVLLNSVKSYVYLKVRLMFDPPANQSLISSMENYIHELEWRINVTVDRGTT